MTDLRIVLLVLLFSTSISCTAFHAVRKRALAPDGLTASEWSLVEFRSMDDTAGVTRPTSPSEFLMQLEPDGNVSMRLGCNRASGSWTALPSLESGSGAFSFGPLTSTRALCPEPRLDQQVMEDFQYVRSYRLEGDRLYLSLLADAGTYTWTRTSAKTASPVQALSPEEGGPRTWEASENFELRESASGDSQSIETVATGARLDNLGCSLQGAEIWCDVQRVGGGARGFVLVHSLKPGVSPDGTIPTGSDDSAYRAGQGEFDATAFITCSETVRQLSSQCEVGVARAGGGDATLVVKLPSGRTRTIFFHLGAPLGTDSSQADGYKELRFSKEADLNLIQVGEERYQIPDAVISGE